MNTILCTLATVALALSVSACFRQGPHAPQAALDACRAPKALLAVRRAALIKAGELGAPAPLLGRLKSEGRATLEEPEVEDYDRGSGRVSCTALFRMQPPGEGAQEISSNVSYEAEPLGGGRWRYRLTDAGEVVQAIASLGPLPPPAEPTPASSQAAEAAVTAPTDEAQTRDDAAAAGDTGHARRPAAAPAPAPAPAPTAATPAPQ